MLSIIWSLSRVPSLFENSYFLQYTKDWFAPLRAASTCQVGWETNPVMHRCYMYVPTPQNWYNSEKVCNDLKGHLAVLTSAQDLNFTRSLCTSSSGCWVRAHGYNISSVTFSGWNQSITATCTGSNCSEVCGLIFNVRDTLVGERCNTSHGLICMKDHGKFLFSPLNLWWTISVFLY